MPALFTHKLGIESFSFSPNKKGQVVARMPYRLYVENGVRKFERPPGSGNFFWENGEAISTPKAEIKAEEKKEVKK